jgi:hypothetical protein
MPAVQGTGVGAREPGSVNCPPAARTVKKLGGEEAMSSMAPAVGERTRAAKASALPRLRSASGSGTHTAQPPCVVDRGDN